MVNKMLSVFSYPTLYYYKYLQTCVHGMDEWVLPSVQCTVYSEGNKHLLLVVAQSVFFVFFFSTVPVAAAVV